jgi:tRNA pseudouridine32 synthase/23S rRNA pseudouridine746 synthase
MQQPRPPVFDAATGALLFEDDHLIVVSKPAGMLAVPGRGPDKQDCLLSRLMAWCPATLLVHRLDQATSGVMLFTKSLAMQRQLSGLFQARLVQKRYVAIVHGQLASDSGVVNLPLIADWPQRPRQKVDLAHGKPSETHWELLRYDAASNQTRVALKPITGRSHQLRVHMLSLGHPIVGDRLYGPIDDAPRMCLHASSLAFAHPADGAEMQFESAPDF